MMMIAPENANHRCNASWYANLIYPCVTFRDVEQGKFWTASVPGSIPALAPTPTPSNMSRRLRLRLLTKCSACGSEISIFAGRSNCLICLHLCRNKSRPILPATTPIPAPSKMFRRLRENVPAPASAPPLHPCIKWMSSLPQCQLNTMQMLRDGSWSFLIT